MMIGLSNKADMPPVVQLCDQAVRGKHFDLFLLPCCPAILHKGLHLKLPLSTLPTHCCNSEKESEELQLISPVDCSAAGSMPSMPHPSRTSRAAHLVDCMHASYRYKRARRSGRSGLSGWQKFAMLPTPIFSQDLFKLRLLGKLAEQYC